MKPLIELLKKFRLLYFWLAISWLALFLVDFLFGWGECCGAIGFFVGELTMISSFLMYGLLEETSSVGFIFSVTVVQFLFWTFIGGAPIYVVHIIRKGKSK